MKTQTKIRVGVTITLLGLIIVMFFYLQQQHELQKYKSVDNFIQGGDITKANLVDSLQTRCDSLYWELFPVQVELGRYEVAYQIFMERNPKAAKQYGDIISNETE
jgi:hypothetical protein